MYTISKHSTALILLFLVTAISATSTTNTAASSSLASSSTSSTMSSATSPQTITVNANSTTTTTAPTNSTTATKTSTTNATTTLTTSTTPNVTITVDSYPEGAELVTVDGNPIVTPVMFGWQVGSMHTLSAINSLSCGLTCKFLFWLWSDGGGQTHNITTPNTPTTYFVVYEQQGTVQSYSNTTTYTTSSTTFSTPSALTAVQSPGFALSVAPSTASLPPDDFVGSTVFTLTLTSIGGWRGGVQFTTSQLPAGVTLSNMPSAYSSDTSSASWNVEVNIAASAQAGSYPIEIAATSGSLIHTASITVQVPGSTVRNLE